MSAVALVFYSWVRLRWSRVMHFMVYMSDVALVYRSSATCSLLASFFLGGLLGHLLGHLVRRLHLLAALKAQGTVAGANS